MSMRRWRMLAILVLWLLLPAVAAAAPPLQEGGPVHVVQPGETLFLIAQRYGTTVQGLVAVNNLADPDRIAVGMRLMIPNIGSDDSDSADSATYWVRPGDTLAIIARRYGTTADALAQRNHLTNPHLIYVGQALVVPAQSTGGGVYVVQNGDTLARIASRYGTTVWAIAQANGLANPSLIYVGQRLLVPAAGEDSSLPSPFIALHMDPAVARQGQTVQLHVQTKGDVTLSGTYDGQPLLFVGGAGEYRTLIGVHAMAAPGMHSLELRCVQGDRQVSMRNMLYVTEGDFGVEYLTFPSDKAALLDPVLVEAEAKRVAGVMAQATLPGAWGSAFDLPLADDPLLVDPFGVRRSYDGGPATSYHGGADYAASEGTEVYAPAPGRVALAEALQVRGNAVIVDHGRGVMTGYWHLSQIDVTAGQRLDRGDLLGRVGNTGLSTGAHLHWELRVLGVQVDPLQWVRDHIE
jgi:murein DD-endopeptidase MepM/ murein hydrolase activator NlpD